MKKPLFALILCFFLFLPALQAGDVRITANLDKQTAHVDEEIHLTLKVIGQTANLQAPRIPRLEGFDAFYTGRASHITFINGVSTASVEFSYTLIPKKTGALTIGPIEIQVDNQTYQTDPMTVQISGAPAAPTRPPVIPQASAPAPSWPSAPSSQPEPEPVVSSENDDNIFVQAWVDRKSIYQNEQVLLTYSLYTRYDTRYEGFDKEPETSGFWIEEFPMERDIERETVKVNGKRYVKADIKKLALFATSPGSYTIQPGSVKVSIRQEPQNNSVFDEFFSDSFFSGGGFFARRENRLLNPPPIQIEIKPLPEKGKPESFQGAVGTFRLSANIDKDQVKQNEPVTLSIVIEGEGNVETINRPKLPDLTGFKTYDADTNSQLFKTGNVIGGKKTFEIVFIPKDAGTAYIPPLGFSYFDPQKEKYVTLQTPNFPIKVERSEQTFKMPDELTNKDLFKKQVRLEGKDIRYINERLPKLWPSQILEWSERLLKAANVLMLLLLGVLVWKDREERIFSKDQGLKRRKLARAAAIASMKRLKKLTQSQESVDTGIFFVELEKAITQYLADKWNLSTYGITRRDLEDQLRQTLGDEDPLLRDVLELYHLCDESRFGKGNIPQASKKMGLKIFQATINRIERMRV